MMEGVDPAGLVATGASTSSSMEESFCIVDRDAAFSAGVPASGSAMLPPSSHVSADQTNTFSSVQPVAAPMTPGVSPGAAHQLPRQAHQLPSTQGQPSTPSLSMTSTPQRHDVVPGSAPPAAGPPMSGPPMSGPPSTDFGTRPGQRMSALRAKPHSELPPAINMSRGVGQAYGQGGPMSSPYQAVGGEGGAAGGPGMAMGPGHAVGSPSSVQYGGMGNQYGQPMQGSGQYGYDSASAGGGQFGTAGHVGPPTDGEAGLWGWVASATNSVMESASKMVNNPDLLVEGAQRLGKNIVDKTKSSMDNVLTTLDPGMTSSGASPSRQHARDMSTPGASLIQAKQIVLTTTKFPKIEAVKAGFQRSFQTVNVRGFVCPSGIAPQPLGLKACYHGAEQRLQYLRSMHSGNLADAILISMENCIAELLPGSFFDIGCLLLHDPAHGITLQALTQPTPLPGHFVQALRSADPPNYAQSESGFSTRWPALLARELPGSDQVDPHRTMVGMSRYRLLETAVSCLARSYELELQKCPQTNAPAPEQMPQHVAPPPTAASMHHSQAAPPPTAATQLPHGQHQQHQQVQLPPPTSQQFQMPATTMVAALPTTGFSQGHHYTQQPQMHQQQPLTPGGGHTPLAQVSAPTQVATNLFQ